MLEPVETIPRTVDVPELELHDGITATMQKYRATTLFSASDLVGFLECEHLTTLGLTDLVTPLARAKDDESAALIQEKGIAHEAKFLASLKADGLRIAEIRAWGDPAELASETRSRDAAGARRHLPGDAPVGRRCTAAPTSCAASSEPSKLGEYSYEVLDTKLARSAKAKFVVQLAFYSDLLADRAGRRAADDASRRSATARSAASASRITPATSGRRANAFSASSRGNLTSRIPRRARTACSARGATFAKHAGRTTTT